MQVGCCTDLHWHSGSSRQASFYASTIRNSSSIWSLKNPSPVSILYSLPNSICRRQGSSIFLPAVPAAAKSSPLFSSHRAFPTARTPLPLLPLLLAAAAAATPRRRCFRFLDAAAAAEKPLNAPGSPVRVFVPPAFLNGWKKGPENSTSFDWKKQTNNHQLLAIMLQSNSNG